MRIETLLQRLETEQSAMAVEALERPSGKTSLIMDAPLACTLDCSGPRKS
jgi:hypothetical protein